MGKNYGKLWFFSINTGGCGISLPILLRLSPDQQPGCGNGLSTLRDGRLQSLLEMNWSTTVISETIQGGLVLVAIQADSKISKYKNEVENVTFEKTKNPVASCVAAFSQNGRSNSPYARTAELSSSVTKCAVAARRRYACCIDSTDLDWSGALTATALYGHFITFSFTSRDLRMREGV